ncbi:MAG: acyl-CoA/acyl-ACP dehydrogenase [Rhodopirellula sp.]|nr:acyl-CoA/acyl-ACP dehydrogenase [Rhodopirellula sp.]
MYRVNEAGSTLIESCRKIATNGVASAAANVDAQAQFPESSIRSLADAGLLGLTLPREVGGHEQTPGAFAAIVEELAQSCASTAMIYVMHITATQAIAASSTLGGKNELLAEIAAGRHLTTLAFSERGSRSQFWAPVSRLDEASHGNFVTSAHKSWVTSASHADSYVSSAQKPGAESPLESVIYLVDRKADGVQVEAGFDGLGLRGNDSTPVTLKDVAVPADRLLTELGAGAPMMLEVVLPWFVVGTAAMANGLCRAAVAATSGHLSAGRFEHDASALRDLPNLRARLAQMSVRTEQSRALLAHTAQAMEQPNEMTPLFVLQSRLAAIQAATDVTDLAMKACGGAAFSKHLGIERLFRDARAGWVMAPTADHLQEFIGRALTGLPLF